MLNMTSIVPEASTSEKSRENWKERLKVKRQGGKKM